MEHKYLIYQRERCPTTDRLHWQGTIIFRNPRNLNGLKRLAPTYHWEPCRDIKKSIAYCSKEESRVGTTIISGTYEGTPNWRETPYIQLWDEHPEYMLRNWRAIREYKSISDAPARTTRVIALWGEPGTGKTWGATNNTPSSFFLKDGSKWWDGYRGQSTIILDDLCGSIPFRDLLRWLDRYPLRVEVKGATVALEGATWILTSNKKPSEWYPNCDFRPLKRRIHICMNCPTSEYWVFDPEHMK